MPLSSKIDLENKIFARAALLKTAVHAKYGGLISAAEDVELQTLLYVYNANFRAENFNNFCTPQDALTPRQYFLSQRTHSPGLTPVYKEQDLDFELVLSEEE